jgi:hypothetical protein
MIQVTGVEGPGRFVPELFPPNMHLVRVNLVALGQIGHARLFPQRLQGDLRLQPRVNLPSCSLGYDPLRLI